MTTQTNECIIRTKLLNKMSGKLGLKASSVLQAKRKRSRSKDSQRRGKRGAEGKIAVGGGHRNERETESKDVLYQSRAADAVLRIENCERKHGAA